MKAEAREILNLVKSLRGRGPELRPSEMEINQDSLIPSAINAIIVDMHGRPIVELYHKFPDTGLWC